MKARSNTRTQQPIPIQALASGHLYRAFVYPPEHMLPRERPMASRTVFFEGPFEGAHAHLQKILTLAWQIDANDWCQLGYIENLVSVQRLLDEWAAGERDTGDMRLFETGSVGNCGFGTGPFGIHYAKREDCDFFVTPRVRQRLDETLLRIEQLPAWKAPAPTVEAAL